MVVWYGSDECGGRRWESRDEEVAMAIARMHFTNGDRRPGLVRDAARHHFGEIEEDQEDRSLPFTMLVH